MSYVIREGSGIASRRLRVLLRVAFAGVLIGAACYVVVAVRSDLAFAPSNTAVEYLLLGIALALALGFEFVNGFHDSANAVATVIYTRALHPSFAVAWAGCWNFVGALLSSGVVAYVLVQLLPIALSLNAGSSVGFAMVFAVLLAAIVWNLGTWYLGLPSSSSYSLIGAILGVALMNQLMHAGDVDAQVDWSQAMAIGKSMRFSAVIGFVLTFVLLVLLRRCVTLPDIFAAPEGDAPPPFWIRFVLILTCTGVSFVHGSNDGQKGMGLIMLVLVGAVPGAYALNHAVTPGETRIFIAVANVAGETLSTYASGAVPHAGMTEAAQREVVESYIQTGVVTPATFHALAQITRGIAQQVAKGGSLADLSHHEVGDLRTRMYLTSEALRLMDDDESIPVSADDREMFETYRGLLDSSTRFVPAWVKVAVAVAMGLGTMVGWRRVSRTVGERIGKKRMTYAQGACAEVATVLTICGAEMLETPVSTSHVLSSGVAGSMVGNRSGLQRGTVVRLIVTWVLTVPASVALSACLFWVFRYVA
jgi:PiT family inorganic phosphate transporter